MLRLRPCLARIVQQQCCSSHCKRAKSSKASSASDGQVGSTATDGRDGRPVDRVSGQRASAGVEMKPEPGKLTARLPLVKNFFVGVVDKELLGYPEVIAREDMAKLQNELLPLKNFFADEVNAHAIDSARSLPATVLEGVQQLGLYGINVAREYEGKGWGWSASLMAMEQESSCVDVALGLLSHRVVIDVLKELGTLEQQQRFLGKLARGELFATEAIYEYDVAEDEFFNTSAEYLTERNEWLLNGTKSYVVCGPLAPTTVTPLFIVIAQTRRANVKGDTGRSTTIFLVEGNAPGVKLGEQHLTMGCRGLQMRQVQFKEVHVPQSCVLGQANDGNQVADVLLRCSRLRNSMLGLGLAKQVVNELSQHCVNNKQCGVTLKDMEGMQMHLSKAVCATYAMESMIYMTAGLLDEFNGQDVTLEAAITKYYSLKELFKMASKCMDIIGPKSLLSGENSEVSFRNAAQLYTQGESMDTLRLYIALTGLQHAGSTLSDTVRKARNPLFHPGHILSKFLQNSNIDNPKTKLCLSENVHPSLEPAAQCVEHSVARLQMCVELLLTRYGSAVVERHEEMKRLAEMSTTIYAMFASISRASRSYCIGLHLADHELLTASTICSHGRDVVRVICTDIFNGQYVNNDNNLQRLSKQVITSKGYFAVHPLTYNY